MKNKISYTIILCMLTLGAYSFCSCANLNEDQSSAANPSASVTEKQLTFGNFTSFTFTGKVAEVRNDGKLILEVDDKYSFENSLYNIKHYNVVQIDQTVLVDPQSICIKTVDFKDNCDYSNIETKDENYKPQVGDELQVFCEETFDSDSDINKLHGYRYIKQADCVKWEKNNVDK